MNTEGEDRVMRKLTILSVLFAFFLCAQMARAADSDYNGRWDIIVHKTPADRAWWLEIKGAGTGNVTGMFSHTPSGLEPIENASIQNGELHFFFDRPATPAMPPATEGGRPRSATQASHVAYTFKYVNGKLEGTMSGTKEDWAMTGERAPVINEHDDGTWVKGTPVTLFNGKDMTGWYGITTGSTTGWTVENGVMMTQGKGENIATKEKFWNFELHAEFKVEEHNSNSGIGLRGRYEVQIANNYGQADPGVHGIGALYHRIPPRVNASKPPGEWQTYDIRLVGRDVTTVLNGVSLYEKGVIDGMTGDLSFDPHEGQPGPIELQGDHATVSFRNIVLTPLVKKGK
jgi:Domain of Unknown Function (DUF1080)